MRDSVPKKLNACGGVPNAAECIGMRPECSLNAAVFCGSKLQHIQSFLSATYVIWYISFMDFKASVATKSFVRIKLESDFSLLSGLILSHTFGGAHVH